MTTLKHFHVSKMNKCSRMFIFLSCSKSCNHHNVEPGSYVIVPTTFDPNQESDFIVRVYTEKPAHAAWVVDSCNKPFHWLLSAGIGNVEMERTALIGSSCSSRHFVAKSGRTRRNRNVVPDCAPRLQEKSWFWPKKPKKHRSFFSIFVIWNYGISRTCVSSFS